MPDREGDNSRGGSALSQEARVKSVHIHGGSILQFKILNTERELWKSSVSKGVIPTCDWWRLLRPTAADASTSSAFSEGKNCVYI